MAKYEFREYAIFRGRAQLDPQRVGKIVEALPDEDKPNALWRAARAKTHYLHGCFEWNVRKAAEAQWRDTAAQIIKCIVVVNGNDDEEPVRAFHSVTTRTHGREFVSIERIAKNTSMQISLLESARRDLDAFEKRYRVLADVCVLVAEARERINTKIKSVQREVV